MLWNRRKFNQAHECGRSLFSGSGNLDWGESGRAYPQEARHEKLMGHAHACTTKWPRMPRRMGSPSQSFDGMETLRNLGRHSVRDGAPRATRKSSNIVAWQRLASMSRPWGWDTAGETCGCSVQGVARRPHLREHSGTSAIAWTDDMVCVN